LDGFDGSICLDGLDVEVSVCAVTVKRKNKKSMVDKYFLDKSLPLYDRFSVTESIIYFELFFFKEKS
jgi:hypothetical protein